MFREPGWKQCSGRWVSLPARTMGGDRGGRVRALQALCVTVVSSHLLGCWLPELLQIVHHQPPHPTLCSHYMGGLGTATADILPQP